MKSENGQAFLNFIFSNSPHSLQNKMVEYYISKYLKIPLDKLLNLNNMDNTLTNNNKENLTDPTDPANDLIIVEKQGTFDQENVRNDLKVHLEKQLEKKVHKSFIFQAFLNKIFDSLDGKTKVYLSELFDDDFSEFLQNKQGIELSCKLFTVASAKIRKKNY